MKARLEHMRAIAAEAFFIAWSQPVVSVVTVLMVTGMVATVLLTTGRTVGAEQAVIATIDDAGTRSITVRADPDSGLTAEVLDRLQGVEGIEWAAAFGTARDVTNAAIPDGVKVPSRLVWTDDLSPLGVPEEQPLTDSTAWISPLALQRLGLVDPVGGVATETGASFAIGGETQVPDNLVFLEPLIVVPQGTTSRTTEIAVLVVVAESPELVAPVSELVQSVLGVTDPTKVKITTSEALANLRAIVQGQLGSFGRSLVIVIFALTAVLVAAILYGLVMMRRKDFGRRRALGASQRLIVGLLLTQTATLSLIGAAIGSAVAAVGLLISNDPLPEFSYFVAVGLLAVLVGTLAALVPAIAASRRDPLTELRVP
ncbi:ABC transporter permease [Schumannella luteola]